MIKQVRVIARTGELISMHDLPYGVTELAAAVQLFNVYKFRVFEAHKDSSPECRVVIGREVLYPPTDSMTGREVSRVIKRAAWSVPDDEKQG